MNRPVFFALTGLSGLAWTLVYVLIIKNSIKDKRCGMPLFALAFNLCWELSPEYVDAQGVLHESFYLIPALLKQSLTKKIKLRKI